ncbi:MAG: hypothetical protein JNL80_12975 [Phycisphaerae bacterium]|nr:hypothetical protein [Phycisphaerae bacterium]
MTPSRWNRRRLAMYVGMAMLGGATVAASAAPIEGISLVGDSYAIETGGGELRVIDLYAKFSLSGWNVLFNAYNSEISLIGGGTWVHDDLSGACPGGSWLPALTPSLVANDSFVTIGATQPGATNPTIIDPLFAATPACSSSLGSGAGWANPSFDQVWQGLAKSNTLHDGATLDASVLIGRFVIDGSAPLNSVLSVNTISFTYYANSFIPTTHAGVSGSFAYVPAPGCGAVLGVGLAARRRSRSRSVGTVASSR